MSDIADVFLSYAHDDRPTARRLAEALQAQGVKVWWDRHLAAGSEFAQEIESRLQTARVVIGLWSAESVRSAFVRDECGRALRAGKLLPLRIAAVDLPLGFGQSHTLDLIDWDGDLDDEAFRQLLDEIRRHLGQAQASRTFAPQTRAWTRRRWSRGAIALAVALLTAGGWWSWQQRQSELQRIEADRHFRAGLAHQFAKEPALVGALNEYLSTLELQPGHARAQYYLAHVYVQNGRPDDALAAFKRALLLKQAPLDASLRADAEKQIKALAPDPAESQAVARRPAAAPSAIDRVPKTAATKPLTVAAPPHPAPEPARLAALADRVDAIFGRDRDQRVSATTGLIVDAPALSDAVPLALDKALGLLQAGTPLDNAASSGIVNTLVLLQSASPGTLTVERAGVEALLAATRPLGETTRAQAARVQLLLNQAADRQPVAYLQIADEVQRPLAEALAARLRKFGYQVPGIEMVGERAPAATEVRAQGKSDQGFARWISRAVGELGGQPARLSTLRNARPTTDTYEVWLGRGLCAPGTPAAPGCKGTVQ
ncbi:hypothetical protein RD110_13160 [Rhodoferax koreense]|uniref:TIR domain-containing protein n=1 Tax=Rhodoferax koreensis TaxID=1842727 RepID=A0A1P8JWA1_9BURK|nr:TIR domain-containing protein [Rhodoferax koreense]APW38025.1 hypothetical protein RD110_13160 [Rhodoferax koreense]